MSASKCWSRSAAPSAPPPIILRHATSLLSMCARIPARRSLCCSTKASPSTSACCANNSTFKHRQPFLDAQRPILGAMTAQRINPKAIGARPREFSPPVFDEDALARADDVLEEMSGQFQEWLESEVEKVQSARLAAAEAGWTEETLEALMLRAHDLKGLGGTYGYPLITQMAGSLCRLIGTPEGRAIAQKAPGLVSAHVDAIRA